MRCSSSVDLVGVAAKLSDCAILPVQAQLQRGSREGTSACRQLWSTVRRVDFRDCRASIRQQPGSERACNILAEVDHLNAHEGQALVHRHRDRLCSPGSRPEVCLLKKRGIRVYYTQISLQHGSSKNNNYSSSSPGAGHGEGVIITVFRPEATPTSLMERPPWSALQKVPEWRPFQESYSAPRLGDFEVLFCRLCI